MSTMTKSQKKLMLTRAKRMIRDGSKIRQAADALGVKASSLGAWLTQDGFKVYDKNEQRNIEIYQKFTSGMSYKELSLEFKLSESNICKIISENKVQGEFEYTFQEIAEELGITERAVIIACQNGLRKLEVICTEMNISIEDIIIVETNW